MAVHVKSLWKTNGDMWRRRRGQKNARTKFNYMFMSCTTNLTGGTKDKGTHNFYIINLIN